MRVPVSCMISPTSLLYGPAMKGWKAFSTSSLSTARLSWRGQDGLVRTAEDKQGFVGLEARRDRKAITRPSEMRLVLCSLGTQKPHLLSRDEKDFMASFLDALFGASDLDLIAGVIWAWDLDFGCSF